MFCEDCGAELKAGDTFCTVCGAGVEKTDVIGSGSRELSGMFVESDETVVAALGNGYLSNFLTGKTIKYCEAILTDKRVYLHGNALKGGSNSLSRECIEQIVDLDDVTGSGFVFDSRKLVHLVQSVIFFLISIATFITNRVEVGTLVGIFFLIASLVLFLIYVCNRKIWFFIDYAGGSVRFDASIYGLAKAQEFHMQVRRMKEKRK